jgi:hypothetical protein
MSNQQHCMTLINNNMNFIWYELFKNCKLKIYIYILVIGFVTEAQG